MKWNHMKNIKWNSDLYDQNINPIFSFDIKLLFNRDPVAAFSIIYSIFRLYNELKMLKDDEWDHRGFQMERMCEKDR